MYSPYTWRMDDVTYFEKALTAERTKLELELNRLGTHDPQNPGSWDVKRPDIDVIDADQNEAADRTEEMHIDSIVLDELEARYRMVRHALGKIAKDAYGTCEVCQNMIEEERLRANPAARTCKAHLGREEDLAL